MLADPASYVRVGLPDAEADFRIADSVPAGALTESLALPWQIGMNQHNYQNHNDPVADNLWPSARIVQVAAKSSGTTDDMDWTRPLTQTGNADIYENQKMASNEDMIRNWSKLGFLTPKKMYIETSRSLPEDPNTPI